MTPADSPWVSTKEAAALARVHPRTLLILRRRHPDILDGRVCATEPGPAGFQWHRERFIAAMDRIRHGIEAAA